MTAENQLLGLALFIHEDKPVNLDEVVLRKMDFILYNYFINFYFFDYRYKYNFKIILFLKC
jgi:hypothetical protein